MFENKFINVEYLFAFDVQDTGACVLRIKTCQMISKYNFYEVDYKTVLITHPYTVVLKSLDIKNTLNKWLIMFPLQLYEKTVGQYKQADRKL